MMTKGMYVELFKGKIDQWNSFLGKLERKVGEFKGETKAKFDKKLADIRAQRDIVAEKFGQISSSADDTWMSLRVEARKAREKLVEAFSVTRCQIGEIIGSKKK